MQALHPSGYPWAEPARTGLLRDGGFVGGSLPEDLEGRTPVAAVGSNASLTVLRHKLGPLLRTGLSVAVAEVENLAVGHSAHVSARGYLAAAPFRGTGSREAVVGWFDAAQLAALDATEPNYRRVALPSGMPCRLGNRPLTCVEVYESVHGVLGENGTPLDLLDQAGALAWLAHRLPPALALTLDHGMLSSAPAREQVRAGLVEAGLVLPSGL